MQEMKDKKSIRHIENKQLNDRSKYLLINNYLLDSPVERQILAEWIKTQIQGCLGSSVS